MARRFGSYFPPLPGCFDDNIMSLLVNAFRRGDKGEMIFLDPSDHSQELAGFESFRTTFYGSQTARNFGLRLLPSLAEADLYVEGRELASLREEAELVLQNINLFTDEAAADWEVLDLRIKNILGAIDRARQANGGVVIW